MNIYLIVDRLQKIQNSKLSIEKIGKLFQEEGRKGFYKELVDQWLKAFNISKLQKKKQAYINLAHEVLQKCKNERNIRFIDQFRQPLLNSLKWVGREGSQQIKSNILKLLSVWQEKKLYGKEFLTQLGSQIDKPSANLVNQQDQLKRQSQILPEGLLYPPPTLVNLIKNIDQVKKYKEKGNSQEMELKYLGFSLESYKRALIQADKKHMKMVLDLKTLLQKIDKLQNYKKNFCQPS